MIKKYFENIYNEALPLSVAKELTKGWNKSRHADWFNNKSRVYLPLLEKLSRNEINGGSELQDQIKDVLRWNGYEVKDYIAGTVENKKYKREEKLGKVLNKIAPEFAKKFQEDPDRQGANAGVDPIVVISRHPYDIAGMSTDRGWTSCKNLGTDKIYGKNINEVGINSKYVKDEIHSLLIAYLIKPDDKNIKNPIARILLVPYMNSRGEVAYLVQKNIYGSAGRVGAIFIKTVQNWIDSKQGKLRGVYKINPFVYPDGMDKEFDADKIDFPKWFKSSETTDADAEMRNNQFVWLNGTWESGTWIDGIWEYGKWMHGVWTNGIWETGRWHNGHWMNGVWQDGKWYNGTWHDGRWENGIWEDGTWQNGTWETGTWNQGRWVKGTWEHGEWLDGTWENGTWEGGIWENGRWYNGTWEGGEWDDGQWYNGTWEKGEWFDGYWAGGTWKDGWWKGGRWKGGEWKRGWIYDPEKKGNFEEDWEWNVDEPEYVFSTISPLEYFAGKEVITPEKEKTKEFVI